MAAPLYLPRTKFDYALDLAIRLGFQTAFSAVAIKLIFRANRR